MLKLLTLFQVSGNTVLLQLYYGHIQYEEQTEAVSTESH